MTKQPQYDEPAYKALYDFQMKEFEDVKSQHSRLEDKAAKYLTFTSIIIAALSIFSKQYLFDIDKKGLFFYIIVFMIVLVFISLSCVARFLFHVVEVSEVGRLQSDKAMINLFTSNDLPVVHFNLARDISDIIKTYDARNRVKVAFLKKAFNEIKFSGLLLVITVLLIILDAILL